MRVLVAEDETIIRLDLRALLERAGFEVCAEARDGEEAVRLARSEQPDVAVLDVKMPVLDGIEAARRILDERPIPIVMLTAYGQEELVQRAAELRSRADRPVDLMVMGVPADARALERYANAGFRRALHWLPSAPRGPARTPGRDRTRHDRPPRPRPRPRPRREGDRRGDPRAGDGGARLRVRGAEPAQLRARLPRPPVHLRARRGDAALDRPRARHRVGRRHPAVADHHPGEQG